jgi:hypothetical protein
MAFLVLTSLPAFAQGQRFEALKDHAFSGNADAQVELGLIHLRIKDSARDRELGLAWFIVAAASGDARAIKLRDRAFSKVNRKTGMGAEKAALKVQRLIEKRTLASTGRAARAPDIVLLAGIGSGRALTAAIEGGAEVNVVTTEGHTPLSAALLARRYDLARVLLAAGAEANPKSDWGRTLLWDVVKRGDVAGVALLLAHGASVFSPDPSGTPIFLSDHVDARIKSLFAFDERDMTRNEVLELQARLTVAGQNPGKIDGLIGRKTWAAFDALAAQKGVTAKLRNPMAALLAVRSFVPSGAYDAEIRKAVRTALTPVHKTASRPKKTKKTAAQTFWGDL